MKWYLKAAQKGNAKAEFAIGQLYENGFGTNRDYKEAMKWFLKASVKDHADAENEIGNLYSAGQGVEQDDAEALKWYLKSADKGNPLAECNVGVGYDFGKGVMVDYQQAVSWYLKASAQNNIQADFNLGVLYENGKGVKQDKTEAVKWYQKAADLGDAEAAKRVALLSSTTSKVVTSSQNSNGYHFTDSLGNDFDYYPDISLFLEANGMVGKFCGGSFTIIKKVNKNGWLVEATANDGVGSATKTFYLKIPKSWDVQTITRDPGAFGVGSKMVSQTSAPHFRALTCLNLIVRVTDKFMKFTNSLDDSEDSIRVLELKAIAAQPCM
jgi:hypothetical protein